MTLTQRRLAKSGITTLNLPLVDLSIFKWPPDPHFLGRVGIAQLADVKRAGDDGRLGDALLVVPLSVAWNSKDTRVWLGLSGLASELGADDLHRRRAALVLLYPARARQSPEIRSPRTGKR